MSTLRLTCMLSTSDWPTSTSGTKRYVLRLRVYVARGYVARGYVARGYVAREHRNARQSHCIVPVTVRVAPVIMLYWVTTRVSDTSSLWHYKCNNDKY